MKGEPELPANQRPSAVDFVVSTDFFRTVGIPLLRGRTFLETDNDKAPHVVIVNEEFVRHNLKGQEPLGKQIALDLSGAPAQWSEIVGVVGNVKTYSDEVRDYPEVYEAFLQRPVGSLGLMVRSGSDPNGLASALRDAVSQVDAELPLSSVMSMHTVIENQKAGNPFFTRVLVIFALLALILAAIGIYGLVSYSVGQRKHEIGIRMAMGAGKGDVLRIVLWQGAKMTLIGATIGLLMALPLPAIFNSMFSGVINVSEPRLYFVVPLAISLVTMLATYIPARRALSVDPMVTLRHE
jgi:putative ABC transport system permease protein